MIEAARRAALTPVLNASQIVADAVRFAYIQPERLSREEFKTALDPLAESDKGAPALPKSAYTPKSSYRDHD